MHHPYNADGSDARATLGLAMGGPRQLHPFVRQRAHSTKLPRSRVGPSPLVASHHASPSAVPEAQPIVSPQLVALFRREPSALEDMVREDGVSQESKGAGTNRQGWQGRAHSRIPQELGPNRETEDECQEGNTPAERCYPTAEPGDSVKVTHADQDSSCHRSRLSNTRISCGAGVRMRTRRPPQWPR